MRNKLAVGLAISIASSGLVAATAGPAAADPVVPCGSKSTYIASGNYYNLTYKNCSATEQFRIAYDENYGDTGACQGQIVPGGWVSWVRLPAPAANNNWEARWC